jgi:hypothetical protein
MRNNYILFYLWITSLKASYNKTLSFMLKQIALLAFMCFLLSCHTERQKSNPADLIKGDWVGPDEIEEKNNNTKYICFDDSNCLLWSADFKYEIRKDTLFIEKENDENQEGLIKYIILKLTTDSLVLRLLRRQQDDTFYLSKIRTKNNITPTAIYFAGYGCWDSCPVLYLEIDSSRNIRIYGNRHSPKPGGFSGRISQNEYNSILRKIRNLPIDTLKEFYEAPWTDDQTRGIAIAHGNTVIRSTAYGHYREPMELLILQGKLINLFRYVNLQPDSSANESYVFLKIKEMTGRLPPPPPKIPLEKFTPPKIEH